MGKGGKGGKGRAWRKVVVGGGEAWRVVGCGGESRTRLGGGVMNKTARTDGPVNGAGWGSGEADDLSMEAARGPTRAQSCAAVKCKQGG